MGKVKYISDIRKFFRESPVVDIHSLKRFLKKKDKRYLYGIIHNLLKKGEIKQITKGFYTIHNDPLLIVFCLKPSYLGLQNAMSIHRLWDQQTNPVVITVLKVRQGLRKVFEHNTILRRIDKRYFFGFDYVLYGDFYVPVSDIEKTFIDLIYYKHYIDPEVIKEFKKRMDKKKLRTYLAHYPPRFRKIVIARINKNETPYIKT